MELDAFLPQTPSLEDDQLDRSDLEPPPEFEEVAERPERRSPPRSAGSSEDPVPVGRGSDPPMGPGEELEKAREEQIVEVPDVPYDTTGFVRKRSMSKRALRLEADSALHSCSHFPHNPLCEVCQLSHMLSLIHI